jgi:hypothetical protein
VLWKDQLFVAMNGRLFGPSGGMFRGTFTPDQKGVQSPLLYRTQAVSGPTHLTKLDFRDGRFLFFTPGSAAYIVPIAEIPGLEESEFGAEICRARGYMNASALLAHFGIGDDFLLFPPHRKPDVIPPPIPMVRIGAAPRPEEIFAARVEAYMRRARLDVQIAGAKTLRVFHAHKDKLFISTELDYQNAWYYDKEGKPIKNLPPAPDRQLRTGKLPKDFPEYFAAYTSAKRDYLVTDHGKVYLAVLKGKTEVEVTKVWDDPKREIVGVVQDLANDAVYGWGFVTTGAAPERFYVKMDPKPVAAEYKRTIPLWADFSDAYLESYECARAFRKAAEKK